VYNDVAFNVSDGDGGTDSKTIKITVNDVIPAPSNLAATPISSTRIQLTWTNNAADATGTEIWYGTDGVNFVHKGNVGQGVNTYTAATSSLNPMYPDTKYYFEARAKRAIVSGYPDYSDFSNIASAATKPLPAAPSGLTAVAMSPTRIDLAWNDNSSDEDGFYVEYSADGVNFVRKGSTGPNTRTFTVKDHPSNPVFPGQTYYCRVQAFRRVPGSRDSAGTDYSPWSNTAGARTAPPNAPSDLAVSNITVTGAALSWKDNSNDETAFKIEQSSDDGATWALIKTAAANIIAYDIAGLTPNTTYKFRLKATNNVGDSDYSNTVAITTLGVPTAPSGLSATAISSSKINLNWTDNASAEDGFKIERSTSSGGPFTQIGTTNANAATYSDTGLNMNTAYYYRVRAYNSVGNSDYSNTAAATTKPNSAPVAVSGAPASVNIAPDTAVTLTTTVSDVDDNIAYSEIFITAPGAPIATNSGKPFCYFWYKADENKLYGSTPYGSVGGFTPGSPNVIDTPYVKLNCRDTTVSKNGDSLTINWNAEFKSIFIGVKNAYFLALDAYGLYDGWKQFSAIHITLANNMPPQAVSVAPSPLYATASTYRFYSLTTVFSDPNGALDLDKCYLLINKTYDGRYGLYAWYDRPNNKIYLLNDDGTAVLGGIAPGAFNKIIENSYVKLNCGTTTVDYGPDSNSLSIKWDICFKPLFGLGWKNDYLYATDTSGADSAYPQQARGHVYISGM
jgi:hypothetical protein